MDERKKKRGVGERVGRTEKETEKQNILQALFDYKSKSLQ